MALFGVGVDTAKGRIYARLGVTDPGPGYCHFPDRYDEEHFRQLTAEKVVTQYYKGFPRRVWVKKSEQRNEPLDCRVYAIAALELLNVRLDDWADAIKARHDTPVVQLVQEDEEREPMQLGAIGGPLTTNSWVNRWRR